MPGQFCKTEEECYAQRVPAVIKPTVVQVSALAGVLCWGGATWAAIVVPQQLTPLKEGNNGLA